MFRNYDSLELRHNKAIGLREVASTGPRNQVCCHFPCFCNFRKRNYFVGENASYGLLKHANKVP